MKHAKVSLAARVRNAGFTIVLWLATAWLLYPLIVLDTVNIQNAKAYLYRSSAGIVIMIIILGKTIFDLLFPLEVSRRKSWVQMVFLTLYSLAITGGVIFMVARMALVYLKKNSTNFNF
jgi:hypothetical protein